MTGTLQMHRKAPAFVNRQLAVIPATSRRHRRDQRIDLDFTPDVPIFQVPQVAAESPFDKLAASSGSIRLSIRNIESQDPVGFVGFALLTQHKGAPLSSIQLMLGFADNVVNRGHGHPIFGQHKLTMVYVVVLRGVKAVTLTAGALNLPDCES